MPFLAQICENSFQVIEFEIEESISYTLFCTLYIEANTNKNMIGLQVSMGYWSGIIIGQTKINSLDRSVNKISFISHFEYILKNIRCELYPSINIMQFLDRYQIKHNLHTAKTYTNLIQYNGRDFDTALQLSGCMNFYFRDQKVHFLTSIPEISFTLEEVNYLQALPNNSQAILLSESKNDVNIYTKCFGLNIQNPKIQPKQFDSKNIEKNNPNLYSSCYKADLTSNSDAAQFIDALNTDTGTRVEIQTSNPNLYAGCYVMMNQTKYIIVNIRHYYNKGYHNIAILSENLLSEPMIRRFDSKQSQTFDIAEIISRDSDKVCIKFNWSENVSKPIPVLTSVAGNGYGTLIMPNPGQKAVIALNLGSQPIVCGVIYDGSHLAIKDNNSFCLQNGSKAVFQDSGLSILASSFNLSSVNNDQTLKESIYTEQSNEGIQRETEIDDIAPGIISLKSDTFFIGVTNSLNIASTSVGYKCSNMSIDAMAVRISAINLVISATNLMLDIHSIDVSKVAPHIINALKSKIFSAE